MMHSDVARQIRALVDEQTAAWNRGDGAGWARPFSEDASFVNIVGMLLSGREQIGDRHAQMFRTLFQGSRSEVTLHSLASAGADTLVARLDYLLTGYRALPPGIAASDATGALRTRMLYVLVRDGQGWSIVAGQNTAIAPALPNSPDPLVPATPR